jgi:hypothetical protein
MATATYVLIESRDPFESTAFDSVCEIGLSLVREGAQVTVFLVENGVFAARQTARIAGLRELTEAGAIVLADDFSMRERGIAENDLSGDVRRASLDELVTMLANGARAMWN